MKITRGRFPHKVPSAAQIQWKKERSDARWEIRVEYLMEFFSSVSTMLPRQMAHQNTANEATRTMKIAPT